jgi:hypothetical protein
MVSAPSAACARALDPAPGACRNSSRLPNDRQPGVLLLLGDPAPLRPLLEHLRQLGVHVDVAADLAGARALFFSTGGHGCLVIGPDVRPGVAARVARSLRAVDPQLPLATFGPGLGVRPRPARDAVLAGFHPASRAGTGALVRFLRAVGVR